MAPKKIMFDFLKNNRLVEEAATARLRPRSLAIHFLLFFLVMSVADMATAMPVAVYTMLRLPSLLDLSQFIGAPSDRVEELTEEIEAATKTLMLEDGYILTTLLSTIFLVLLTVIYCRFIERRPLSSMGLSCHRRVPVQYAAGIGIGLLLFGLVFAILYVTGAITVTGGSFSVGMLLLYLIAFLIQGAAEEVLVRGYFMISLTSAVRPGAAVICSALLFSVIHMRNAGISFLAFLNIFLFGVFLGLLVFRTGNLYMACALHGIWNFAEGNLFGTPVSGISPGHSVLFSTLKVGRELTNGGLFGPEGGVVVTFVLFLAIAVLLLLSDKKKNDSN